jgi:hypothetical protein
MMPAKKPGCDWIGIGKLVALEEEEELELYATEKKMASPGYKDSPDAGCRKTPEKEGSMSDPTNNDSPTMEITDTSVSPTGEKLEFSERLVSEFGQRMDSDIFEIQKTLDMAKKTTFSTIKKKNPNRADIDSDFRNNSEPQPIGHIDSLRHEILKVQIGQLGDETPIKEFTAGVAHGGEPLAQNTDV